PESSGAVLEELMMLFKPFLHSTTRSSVRQPCGVRPRGQRPQRRRAGRMAAPCASAAGQTLVEFALVLVVFMLVTVGLLDGMRVIFYYSQIQEAARLGARWGAVQVGRAVPLSNAQASTTDAVGGTFATPGNAPATYCNVGCGTNTIDATRVFTVSNVVTNTIVGATMLGTTAVD